MCLINLRKYYKSGIESQGWKDGGYVTKPRVGVEHKAMQSKKETKSSGNNEMDRGKKRQKIDKTVKKVRKWRREKVRQNS